MTKLDLLMLTLIHVAACEVRNQNDEYCNSEVFRPQCLKGEVIIMKNATYGRMKVGRCLTAEEVETHRAAVGDDPRYFGCSVDVLDLLDQRCSGKTDCDVRVAEILEKNIKPCLTGLMVYLEASYDCITVVDERRSCMIKALTNPTHIISTSSNQRICGTESLPWIVESPVGQKISVTIIDFNSKVTDNGNKQRCNSYGTIVDKTSHRNVSVCGSRGQRKRKLYVSTGNALEIYFNSIDFKDGSKNETHFMFNLEAVGCSDVIPGEETWLKRKDDAIVIGCYSSRQTWQLSCIEGKWIGVFGNCSISRTPESKETEEPSILPTISDQEQVLAIVAISGCAFAICLVIVCVGVVCLRRFHLRYKRQHEYKTLSLQRNPEAEQQLNRGIPFVAETQSTEKDERGFSSKPMPTYSVYVEENGFGDKRDNANIFN